MKKEIKEISKEVMDWRKIEICKIIFELIDAGFYVKLTPKGFSIEEVFKSRSRDKWDIKQVADTWGTMSHFDEEGNVLNLTLDSLRIYKKELLQDEKYPLTKTE